MIPEDRRDGPGADEESTQLQAAGSVRKGCDTLAAQTPCGRLQSRRARIHQQINKELRMRTGAENLYRATSNARVRETVALELSYVNSSLQLLKEELEELNCSVDTDMPDREGTTVPMIPLGLKETKELDWSTALKELISGHFGEDGASYETEIRELTNLRQAVRTPSRSESGLELLTAYYNQLCLLDARFVTPARSLGLLFQWGPGPAAGASLREGQCALQHRSPPHPDRGTPGPWLPHGHQPRCGVLPEGCWGLQPPETEVLPRTQPGHEPRLTVHAGAAHGRPGSGVCLRGPLASSPHGAP